MSKTATVKTIITNDTQRMKFMPKHFGARRMMQVEGRIYAYADLMLEGYHGGMWQFADIGNAGYLIPPKLKPSEKAPAGTCRFHGRELSGFDGILSPDGAGLALTILAVNHEWQRDPENDKLGETWEALMEFSHTHPDSDELWQILD